MENAGIAVKNFEANFVGSFYKLDALPRDQRPQIAVAGRSNVGKSTLLNQLVSKRKLAKVSSTPGKTQALNFFMADERFYLVDLPGYGYAKVSKTTRASWGQLIEDYLVTDKRLIGLILLIDCRRDVTKEDWQLIEWLAERKLPVLVVVTKADKLNRDQLGRKVAAIERELGAPAMGFSSMTGEGKNDLFGSVSGLVDEHFTTIKAK